MLVKFTCKNFRSIGMEPICLDMVASGRIRLHSDHVREPISGTSLLRNAAIYGANAAGKSNILKALHFMKSSVQRGALFPDSAKEYCRAGEGHSGQESTFEIQFVTNGRAYDYGFSCLLNTHKITSEWLYSLQGSPSPIFERNEIGSITIGKEIQRSGTESDSQRFNIYCEDFVAQARQNHSLLFLPFIGQGKQFDENSEFGALKQALAWLNTRLQIMSANQPSPTSEFYRSDKSLDDVAQVLASLDTGISQLHKRQINMSELDKYIDPGVILGIKKMLEQNIQTSTNGSNFAITIRNGEAFIGIEVKDEGDPEVTILTIRHQNSLFDFDFKDESDGTKRLFDFMDILFLKSSDVVFVVDEIDRSLHPMLTQQLIELFNKTHRNDDCQLIFTTHENDIMSYKYLRKDEIWLIDRNEQGYSKLYPLDTFEEIRSDSRLSKQYLEGRYGAIPILSPNQALATLEGGEE